MMLLREPVFLVAIIVTVTLHIGLVIWIRALIRSDRHQPPDGEPERHRRDLGVDPE